MADAQQAEQTYWRKCTTCKKLINFGQKYWVCSVSTCTRARTGLVFCDVACFDAHVPVLNHKDAGAFEKRAPSLKEWQAQQAPPTPKPAAPKPPAQAASGAPKPAQPTTAALQAKPAPQSILRSASGTQTSSAPAVRTTTAEGEPIKEILVVVSKVKEYISKRSGGMSTSDSVMRVLSDKIRTRTNDAIRRAAADGRKTVLDRDY